MAGWILTKGLQNLRQQLNDWAPGRDHTSDGTIGDTAHQAETSGHNPDDTAGSRPEWNGDPDSTPEVRALDIDSDFRNGVDAQVLVDHLRQLPHLGTVIRYMIYNRKIYHAPDFLRETYAGASPHTEHIHFSGAFTQAADNDTTFDYRLEDIPVSLTNDDKTWLTAQFRAVAEDVWAQKIGNPDWPGRTAKQALNDLSVLRDTVADKAVGTQHVVAGTPLGDAIALLDTTLGARAAVREPELGARAAVREPEPPTA